MIGKWKEGLKNAGLQLQFNLFYIGMLMFLVPAITVFLLLAEPENSL